MLNDQLNIFLNVTESKDFNLSHKDYNNTEDLKNKKDVIIDEHVSYFIIKIC